MFKSIRVPVDVAHRGSWAHALPQAIELAAGAKGTVRIMIFIRDLRMKFEGAYLPFRLKRMTADARSKLAADISNHSTHGIEKSSEARMGALAVKSCSWRRIERSSSS